MTSTIKVDTISENTSANGVAVDGVTLKDGGIAATGDISLDGGNFVFNESSADKDFRVESNNNTHALFVEGSDGGIGIGVSSIEANAQVHIEGSEEYVVIKHAGQMGIKLYGDDTNVLYSYDKSGNSLTGGITFNHADGTTIFNTGGANERMRIDSVGHVTMPHQPCVRVNMNNGAQNNITAGANATLILANEIFDVGGDFASNTFTAPVTGKYFFSLTTRLSDVDSAADYVQMVIAGSNRNTTLNTYIPGIQQSADASSVTMNGAIILDMDANDTATARIRIQGGHDTTDLSDDGTCLYIHKLS